MKLTTEQIKEYAQTNFDEDDDIILPDNLLAECFFILFILIDIIKNKTRTKEKIIKLRRQIYFYIKWQKSRK